MRKYLDAVVGGVLIAFNLALRPCLHSWRTRWNATTDEVKEPQPGDEIVKAPTWTYTHAITILAPRAAVWPWLVQIGQGRGGFFSYEVLENLAGCDIHNVPELRSELQQLRAGDRVRMHANGFGPSVSILDPERALVLGGPPDANGSQATWGFYLHQTEDGVTRVIERGRHAVGDGTLAKLGFGPYLIDPVSFVMSRRMLKTSSVWPRPRRGDRNSCECCPSAAAQAPDMLPDAQPDWLWSRTPSCRTDFSICDENRAWSSTEAKTS